MNENSIYRNIMKQISETGSLPDGCTIAKQEYGNVVFAEGCLEHFGKGLGQMEKLSIEFENLLDDMAAGNLMDPSKITEEAFRTSETSMRNLDGCLEEWMEAHVSLFNDQTLCAYASSVILNTGSVEALKFAITLCSYIHTIPEDLGTMIISLASCSELSLRCMPILETLPDGNDAIFRIARNERGYALVDAVYALKAETKEEKDWLMHNGVDCFLGWYYTGGTVAKKCGFMSMLEDTNLSEDHLGCISEIVSNFFAEGPTVNLIKNTDWKEMMLKTLDVIEQRPGGMRMYDVRQMRRYSAGEIKDRDYEDAEEKMLTPFHQQIVERCTEILTSEKIHAWFAAEKKQHREYAGASELGMDCSKEAMEDLEADYEHNGTAMKFVFKHRKYYRRSIAIADAYFHDHWQDVKNDSHLLGMAYAAMNVICECPGSGYEVIRSLLSLANTDHAWQASSLIMEWKDQGIVIPDDILDLAEKEQMEEEQEGMEEIN